MAADWMGVASSYPRADSVASSSGRNPRAAKEASALSLCEVTTERYPSWIQSASSARRPHLGATLCRPPTNLLPFAAGNFVYIALADLVPELKASITPATETVDVAFFTLGLALLYGLAAWT